jgi:hypothetical protein
MHTPNDAVTRSFMLNLHTSICVGSGSIYDSPPIEPIKILNTAGKLVDEVEFYVEIILAIAC